MLDVAWSSLNSKDFRTLGERAQGLFKNKLCTSKEVICQTIILGTGGLVQYSLFFLDLFILFRGLLLVAALFLNQAVYYHYSVFFIYLELEKSLEGRSTLI